MENVVPALIAFTSAVLVGFGGHFVAEDYRRFRDGKAIAAALAGELRSITLSLPVLLRGLKEIRLLLSSPSSISLPEIPDQKSPVFEATADKIGLLGVDLAGEVAFLYDQIRAFRTSFQLLSKTQPLMGFSRSSHLVESCIALIKSNEPKAQALVASLRRHSEISYMASRLVQLGCALLVLLSGIASVSLIRLAGGIFCAVPI